MFQHSNMRSYRSRWQFLGAGRAGGALEWRAASRAVSDRSW